MPRCKIATITVDRPALFDGERAIRSAEWLDAKAEEMESEPNCYALQGWTARRINGLDETVTKLRVNAAGCLSSETRKRIARWLRSRAAYLRKHHAVALTSRRGWFRQDFAL